MGSSPCLLVESVFLIFLVFCVVLWFLWFWCCFSSGCVPNISFVFSNAYLMFWSKYHSFNNLKFEKPENANELNGRHKHTNLKRQNGTI